MAMFSTEFFNSLSHKRTFTYTVIYVRSTPESRQQDGCRFTSACDPKRTFSRNLRFSRWVPKTSDLHALVAGGYRHPGAAPGPRGNSNNFEFPTCAASLTACTNLSAQLAPVAATAERVAEKGDTCTDTYVSQMRRNDP